MKFTWHTTAGGTSAHHGSGYTAHGDFGDYHVWPPQTRWGGYSLKWANTQGRRAPHGGLWHDLGSFRSPAAAKKAAREHAESLDGERDRHRDTNKPRGRAQSAILSYLMRHPGSHALTDVARAPSLRGVHFASIMSAAKALEKRRLVEYDGVRIRSASSSRDRTRRVPSARRSLRRRSS